VRFAVGPQAVGEIQAFRDLFCHGGWKPLHCSKGIIGQSMSEKLGKLWKISHKWKIHLRHLFEKGHIGRPGLSGRIFSASVSIYLPHAASLSLKRRIKKTRV
jgi:hypothetical protein